MTQTLQLIPVNELDEINSIKEGLQSVYDLCISKAIRASQENRQLEMSAAMEDAEAVKRIIRTLRSV